MSGALVNTSSGLNRGASFCCLGVATANPGSTGLCFVGASPSAQGSSIPACVSAAEGTRETRSSVGRSSPLSAGGSTAAGAAITGVGADCSGESGSTGGRERRRGRLFQQGGAPWGTTDTRISYSSPKKLEARSSTAAA